ncbi:MAG: mechanosensitive ion channel family protein [Lachnospiraceae bacterium]
MSAAESAVGAVLRMARAERTLTFMTKGKTMGTDLINSLMEKIQWDPNSALRFLIHVVLAILVYFIGTKVIGKLCKILRRSLEHTKIELSVIQFMVSFAKTSLYIFLIFMIAIQLGVKESSIAALLASAGVGISLALQGGLSNLAGGLLILFLKPFQIGDYIIENTGKQEGTVAKIEMFYTTLTTVDNRRITIPNGSLTNTSIVNLTAQDKRMVEIKVGISYDADIQKAKELIQKLLDEDSDILSDQDVKIFVDELGDHAVIIGLRAWVKTEKFWDTKWRLNEAIKLQFDTHGIQIPYQQLEVHVNQ